MRSILILFWCFNFLDLLSQALPNQVFLFTIESSDKTVVHSPQLLTQFNAAGYNNQPFFKSENELLLTVQTPGSNQTDIYNFDLNLRTKHQITRTSLSEYSPTITPDGKYLSTVRVDEQSTALQRLYKYDLVSGKVESPLPDIKNVGYHFWLDEKNVALFLVNKPSQVALVHTDTKDPLIFSSDIGRCLNKTNQGHLLYVHKLTDEYWYIKSYDPVLQKARIVGETIPKVEDFALTSDGKIIMGKDSKLFVMDAQSENKVWTEIADLKYFGITNIKRLATKGKYLALVDQR